MHTETACIKALPNAHTTAYADTVAICAYLAPLLCELVIDELDERVPRGLHLRIELRNLRDPFVLLKVRGEFVNTLYGAA